ncbi:MAG: AAA-like domain-containing protein [Desulfovibrio sp.]|jgi:hypothetical protein|nr:AAA-like domain-containing protein [Desulfovibrio sp.]
MKINLDDTTTEKRFNIEGPCDPERHYMVPALERLRIARDIAIRGDYFLIHAPSQSGKSTFSEQIVNEINKTNDFHAIYCSLEPLNEFSDVNDGLSIIIDIINNEIECSHYLSSFGIERQKSGSLISGIRLALHNIAKAIDRKLIVFFDDVDCIHDEILITFLSQIRVGFNYRRKLMFPWSIAYIGLSSLHSYKVRLNAKCEDPETASPFNIIAESFRLESFDERQVELLYKQHTDATGQKFTPDAMKCAFYWSNGQPWLVNALAHQVVENDLRLDYSKVITAEHFNEAVHAILGRNDPHIGYLFEVLEDPRVERVVDPMLCGENYVSDSFFDDLTYCLDIGLLSKNASGDICPSNPIYCEAIVWTLSFDIQADLPETIVYKWMDEENFDISSLLKEFQKFWYVHIKTCKKHYSYKQSVQQLSLLGFIQGVIIDAAELKYELALGSFRVGVCVIYEGTAYPIEIRQANTTSMPDALEQLSRYIDRCGAYEGWLVVFDRSKSRSRDEKITWRVEFLPNGKTVNVVGC